MCTTADVEIFFQVDAHFGCFYWQPQRTFKMNTEKQKAEWLQSLKAGDEVIYIDRSSKSVRKVIRVTPKQVIVSIGNTNDYDVAFWKKDGIKVGGATDSWSAASSIAMPTAEVVAAIREKNKFRKLLKWVEDENFSLEELCAMKSAVDAIRESVKPT